MRASKSLDQELQAASMDGDLDGEIWLYDAKMRDWGHMPKMSW